MNDKPRSRNKTFEDENLKIRQFSKSKISPNFNTVEVSFDILVQNKKAIEQKGIQEIKEVHNMRYFFLPELEYYLNQVGLKLKNSFKWMSKSPLNINSWYGVVIAQLN